MSFSSFFNINEEENKEIGEKRDRYAHFIALIECVLCNIYEKNKGNKEE